MVMMIVARAVLAGAAMAKASRTSGAWTKGFASLLETGVEGSAGGSGGCDCGNDGGTRPENSEQTPAGRRGLV